MLDPWKDRLAWLGGPQVIYNGAMVLTGLRILGTLPLSRVPRGGEGRKEMTVTCFRVIDEK